MEVDDSKIGCFLLVVGVIVAALFVWHDASKPVPPPTPEEVRIQQARAKWTISYEGEFADDSAYSHTHRIYRITHADGTELICVTGVGLERGSHRSGRHNVEDER